MTISNLKKYIGVGVFYLLIIASVFLLSARFKELNNNMEEGLKTVAIAK